MSNRQTGRVVKPRGANVWDVAKPTYHGSEPRRKLLAAGGRLMRRGAAQQGRRRP